VKVPRKHGERFDCLFGSKDTCVGALIGQRERKRERKGLPLFADILKSKLL